jgi:hypothetical protein
MNSKITTEIYFQKFNKTVEVHLTKGELLLLMAMDSEDRFQYTYEFSKALEIKTNGKYNTLIIYKHEGFPENLLYANLSRKERFQLNWMNGNHHFQKYHDKYLTYVVAPFFGGLGLTAVGIIDWIKSLLQTIGK